MARKRVAKHMPADLAQTRSLQTSYSGRLHWFLSTSDRPDRKTPTPPASAGALQDVPQIGTEFDLPRSPAPWSTDYPRTLDCLTMILPVTNPHPSTEAPESRLPQPRLHRHPIIVRHSPSPVAKNLAASSKVRKSNSTSAPQPLELRHMLISSHSSATESIRRKTMRCC